jgi:hypothetical protein
MCLDDPGIRLPAASLEVGKVKVQALYC